jgi:hypothetical protein
MNTYCIPIDKTKTWISNLVDTTRYEHLLYLY